MKLQSFSQGVWTEGTGTGTELYNAVNGDVIATATTTGLDFKGMLHYGRTVGGPALRKMTFHERARMLKALAQHLNEKKAVFYALSSATGATKGDSWIDIDGGIGTMFVFASKGRRELPNERFAVDGKPELLSKGGTFIAQHIYTPLQGVAIHINAFNFPCWGMLEKIAVNLLAGMPCIVKPATSTSFLAEAMAKEIISSNLLPAGAFQFLAGSTGDLLEHVSEQDVVTFTGSASTGRKLKSMPSIINNSVRFNMEADSLNCCILGPDATPDTEEFKLFVKEVVREVTVKAGQKCTAIRRVIVPENLAEAVMNAVKDRFATNITGDPTAEGVRMGPLASRDQVADVKEKVQQLMTACELVYGNYDSLEVKGADKLKGAFFPATLLWCAKPFATDAPHAVEAFGPVTTVMPYKTTDEAIELAKMGRGSLVGSVFTASDDFAAEVVLGAACMHGRMLVINRDCAGESTGHGSPLGHLVHGGPGRAGGGEEMGGIRGVYHYMQRTAVQGSPTTLSRIANQYMPKAAQKEDRVHPFRKHFEELEIGETLVTAKRTVTEADIVNFSNVSWDHFYAHTDATSLEGTVFEGRVAHGYFILSAAAGLFVDAKKGPVLLNYGLDECRFTKPVYPGSTIGVKLTVKEKVDQEKRNPEDIAKGIVKWVVDVYDETCETVAIATILTMVKKLNQN
jgi:oxepin-CoA hydrolase / 3-oxo-5,6-dehydrosuberyl-CoA semialdehyde dehydrogenase